MAFTYSDDLSSDRAKVRFHLQDVTESSGPRPGGGNFSDAEVDGLITLGGSWERAVSSGLDALAVAWAKYADLTEGPHRESLSQIGATYRKQASEWRAIYGIAVPARVAGIIKIDGYSDDVTSDDVNTASEYGLVWEYVRIKE